MSDPTTPFRGLSVPTTGSDVGTWGPIINANFSVIDGQQGGFATVPLTNTNVVLTSPAGYTPTPGAGPTQSQTALIRFTGALTNNCNVTFPLPGLYVVENLCTNTNNFVVLLNNGVGNAIGAPPGKKQTIFNDGTNMDFVNMPDPGTAYDLHGATNYPLWMQACTVLPYLIKNGAVYNSATYPALAALLGSTFGGNGSTTFGVPDEMNRARIGFDSTGATNRLTAAVCGINGTLMGSAGGNQSLQQHSHGVNDPTHVHGVPVGNTSDFGNISGAVTGSNKFWTGSGNAVATSAAATGITIQNQGAGSSQNVQPSIISFLPLIKTAILLGALLSSALYLSQGAGLV